MAYLRELPGGGLRPMAPGSVPLGDLGWTVKTNLTPEGHEDLTRQALGPARTITFLVAGRPMPRRVTPGEEKEIIEGNISVDLGARSWLGTRWGWRDILTKSEQKRHALRYDYGQKTPDALRDIAAHLRSLFVGTIPERDAGAQLRRIGETLHLIQDSVSPAHTERHPSRRWCINYVRNYGRGSSPTEHGKVDSRDKIAESATEAARAVALSRRYLEIVFKAIHCRKTGDSAALTEANAEFNRFVDEHFAQCPP